MTQEQIPEAWIGQDVLVLLDHSAVADLVPDLRPGLELTLTLESVSPCGALLKQKFQDPSRGYRVGSVFYPWSSIRRIRPNEMP